MNAHGNNLVLLREEKEENKERKENEERYNMPQNLNSSSVRECSYSFLAPLDFDMSYTRENCCFGE